MKKKVLLFSNCKPVNGFERSIIYDTQRGDYKFIPNSLFEILTKHYNKSIQDIQKCYNNKYDDIIEDYFNYLLNEDYVFFTKEPELFPKIDLEWFNPSTITNCIFCFSKNTKYQLKSIYNQIEELGIKAIQFRFFNRLNLTQIQNILTIFDKSRVQHIEIIIPYNNKINSDDWKKIFYKNQRLFNVLCFKSIEDKIFFVDEQKQHPVLYITENITDHSFCGNIYPNNFVNNLTFFTESINYNTCLNRKLCIDENGYIKNCPSMKKHYGHISNTDIKEVVQSE